MNKIISLAICILILGGCTNVENVDTTKESIQLETTTAPTTTQETEAPKKETIISFAAVGDNLLHNTVSYSAQNEKGEFDFSEIYSEISPIISNFDLAFVNQEIPLAGEGYKISGYPMFNGPTEAADGLFNAGFNIINIASNHSLDKGLNGFLRTYENVQKSGFDKVVGIFPDEENIDNFLIFQEQGIDIGMLSYTYGTNGIPIPASNPNVVPIIDKEKITKDVNIIRDKCDVLIVSLHWGLEYKTIPTEQQKELAKMLNELKVDVIIGHHPHVIEPMEEIVGENGNKTTCFYSLGNFISNQHDALTMLGAMADFDIVKTVEDTVEIRNAGVLPIVTHYNGRANFYRTYALDNYTEELASVHGVLKYDARFSLEWLKKTAYEILGENMLTLGDVQ